ncbi:MAG: lauroyl acyltransferase [Rhodospirillaceae bacterium]|nr:lauroyl acyltransferase [Rhodospirillaceae bacterium]
MADAHTQPYKHPAPPRFKHRVEAALAQSVFAVLKNLPMDTASAFGGWLGRHIGPLTGAHRTATRNIARALPELTPETQRRVLSDMWENFGRTMMEYAVLPRLAAASGSALAERVTVEGHEPLAALVAAGKPAVLFGGHIANWEVMPLILARAAKPQVIVYRPANNPLVDKIIGDVRAPYTAGMAPKGAQGARQMLKALAAGEHLIMLVDQKINTGLPAPFFGRDAFTGPAVARMAMRYDCPVFPVRTQRLDGCRFKVTVEEPWRFPPHGSDADVAMALARVNATLEEWIRIHPGQWMWMHKRWPD